MRRLYLIFAGYMCLASGMGISAHASEKTDMLASILTKEQKAGEMLMVSPSQLAGGGDWTGSIDQVLQAVDQYNIGNLIFFREDLEKPEAVKMLTDRLSQRNYIIPVLTAADPQGSLKEGFAKPTGMTDGVMTLESDGEIWCYGVAGAPDGELAELGIMLDLSAGDGKDAAVVTHVKSPESDAADSKRACSLSRTMVTGTLKKEYDGMVLTDSLSSPDVTETYGADMAVQYALQAGNDILVAPANLMTAYYGMLSAMDEQLVSEEQINESVKKILAKKERFIESWE